jgi:hypothetical protein
MVMQPPVRNRPTEYRRPRRFNVVSVSMLLMMMLGVYLIYCTWPVMALRLRVKGELEDMITRFWRMNLRGDQVLRTELKPLRQELEAKIHGVGVRDKALQVVMEPGKQRVAIEAHFTASAYFPGIDKTYVFHLAPRAETDASRVDW